MRRSGWRLAALLAVCSLPPAGGDADAQTPAPSHLPVNAVRVATPPVIDGRLADEQWALAQPASGFTQREPDEGRPATAETEIRILYDDTALYVAARLIDPEPGRIAARLSPRDSSFDADWIGVYLDPMHDRLTGAVFRVSAANVQQDQLIFNDTSTETSWDAVWQSAVSIAEDGWTAELRIPLSQLRFPDADAQVWGINVERYVRRRNENSFLEMVPRNESGFASRMVDLTGLNGLRPRRRLELLPYVSARNEFIAPETAGDPFNDGARAFASTGLDVKVGLTSNLTLNATINPDFGHVEVDPAVVNLTAFETFFEEKRPFFIEGSQIFSSFGFGGSNSFWGFNTTDPTIFYSRRIGRPPQVDAEGDFVETPAATTILGAAKLTGKTSNGWSLGFLEAITSGEAARIIEDGQARRAAVEPVTNYALARMQREVGRFGTGFLVTATNRRQSERFRDELTRSAYVAGVDGYVFLDAARQWVITGKIAASQVRGTTAVIEDVQQRSQRYFQRPDATHVELDPTRTSLSGYTSRVLLNRNSGRWRVNAQFFGTSPGYESNDLGFHGNADRSGAHGVFQWRENTPHGPFRTWNAWVAKWWTWNYARQLQGDGIQGNAFTQFRNYWTAGIGGGIRRQTFDDRLTRGGPLALNPGGGFVNTSFGTDARRSVSVNPGYNYNWTSEGGWTHNVNIPLTIKPSARLTISTGPQWNRNHTTAQYVDTLEDAQATATYGHRYIFGDLQQSQLTMTTRASVTLSPKLSIQLFAQPLIAAGDYTTFKQFAAPRTFSFVPYVQQSPEGEFDNPDFNLTSLRFNAVMRWEPKPGSTLYVVWTRLQEDDGTREGHFALGSDSRRLFTAKGDDVVLVKVAYWLGR